MVRPSPAEGIWGLEASPAVATPESAQLIAMLPTQAPRTFSGGRGEGLPGPWGDPGAAPGCLAQTGLG